MTTTIAGIAIPDSALARSATELIRDAAPPLLYDHSRRVFLWASLQALRHDLAHDPELLYVAALFHDLGLVAGHRSAHERFEIDGANAARRFLESHGVPEERVMTVWEAVALHTTPEIPFYKQPEVRLVTEGVAYDVVGRDVDAIAPAARAAVLAAHPRADFAEGIIDAFYEGMKDKPETAFGTFNTDVLADRDKTYVKPDLCAMIRRSPLGS
jgi:HD superfamily phosphodiesterase